MLPVTNLPWRGHPPYRVPKVPHNPSMCTTLYFLSTWLESWVRRLLASQGQKLLSSPMNHALVVLKTLQERVNDDNVEDHGSRPPWLWRHYHLGMGPMPPEREAAPVNPQAQDHILLSQSPGKRPRTLQP